ncbi:MAG: hypothetical protein ACJ8DJ_07320 [Gemmatimonadales bacterium]
MNGFLRIVKHLGIAALLVIGLAVCSAVAAADSGSGSDGGDHHSSSGDSGKDISGGGEDQSGGDQSGDHQGGDQQDNGGDNGGDKGKSGDEGKSEDHRRDGNGSLPNPGRPHQGKDLNVQPKGTIKVRLPGHRRSVRLKKGASVPVGSTVDARKGEVTLTTVPREDGAKQWAAFSGGVFKVAQAKTGPPVTDIRLRGGNFASCGRPFANRSLLGRVFASSNRSRKVRSLWGRGKGHFRTRGRNGAATVRGTVWLTEDRCDGTLVRVRRGLVAVHDFTKHKFVDVPAGHSYFARR